MKNRVLLTESLKEAIKTELSIDADKIGEKELLAALRNSKKFIVSLQENGTYKVRQVLKG